MPLTDDELEQRMLRADPARGQATTVADDTLDHLLAGAATSGARRSGHRRRLAGFGIAGALVLGGAVAAPAAADAIRFLAQSDWSCTFGTECIEHGGQWVDTSASDLEEYSEGLYPRHLPHPPGTDPDELRRSAVAGLQANPGLQEEIGIIRSFESRLYCAWVAEWLAADDINDAAARDVAATVMTDAATWPGIVATDGGGIAEGTRRMGEAAQDGDREIVLYAAQMSACDAADGQEHPAGDELMRAVTRDLGLS